MLTRSCALLLGCVLFVAPALAGSSCPSSPPSTLRLPHAQAALTHRQELLIVAMGSSSTQGVMASNLGHSYPAQLQEMLEAEVPQGHVAVINRGVGGQDAGGESDRLDADVIAVRPQLVIWQVGANGALGAESIDRFRVLVLAGVRKLQAAGMDVVLMDNQRSPRILASGKDAEFNQALADIADETGASLFSRDRLMLGWEQEGTPEAEFIARDGLHQNDQGYRCVARALADEIAAAISPRAVTASR